MIPENYLIDLRDKILAYEDAMGVPTIKETFRILLSNDTSGIALVDKTDGTTTMFYVFKPQRSVKWLYICPSKNHIEMFKLFITEYERVDAENKARRGCDVPTI